MAITSDYAKIKFNIGSFDLDTSLILPATSLKNRFQLEITEPINGELPGWDDAPTPIYVLLKITFEGVVLYKNVQFDDASFTVAPTDPDIKDDEDTPSFQEVTYYRNFGMVVGNDSLVSNGKYTVEAKFVYFNLDGDWVFVESTFIANLDFERKKPVLSEWNDQGVPKLVVSDTQDYALDGNVAVTATEFVLSPPQNRANITNTFDNIQDIVYGSYWTGGNEITYTILATYNYTAYTIVTAEQAYDSFVIYYMDWCATYNCLNELYKAATATNCSTKQQSIYQSKLDRATSIIQQIQIGAGCGKESLSELVEELNSLLDCDCGCLDETPRFIAPPNVITPDDVQIINAGDTETEVDLNEGDTIFINMDVSGNTTEISIDNITLYGEYRFILKNDSEEPTMTATFTSAFQDSDGDMASVAVSTGDSVIVDFFAISDSVLQLVSRSDA